MAKRRKSYRGTPAQHTKDASLLLQIMRRAASNARKAADQGNCQSAMSHLTQASAEYGAYAYAKGHTARKMQNPSRRGLVVIPRNEPAYGVIKTLTRTERHVAKKCFIKRF